MATAEKGREITEIVNKSLKKIVTDLYLINND